MKNRVKVLSFPSAFTWERKETSFDDKTRLSDILKKCLPREDMIDRAVVWVQDQAMKYPPIPIEREYYDSTIVKKDTIVTLRLAPTGGDGGKDIFRLVATLALIYFSGGYAAPFAEALGVSEAVAGGLIMVTGMYAVNALIPPPQLNFDRGGGGVKESPSLSITGAQNQMNPYGVVPRVFGKMKVFPVMAAQPYTEISGNKQYLRLLFDFGYGELDLSELKIGDTDITEFEEVETEIQYGTGAEGDFKLYSTQIKEVPQNLVLTNSGGAQTLTTTVETNEAIIDSSFAGLVSISDDGTNQQHSVDIKYEWSVAGAGSWTTDATVTYTNNTRQPYYITHRISFASTGQYDVRITRVTADSASELILDVITIRNLKSVTDSSPITVSGRCMVAMRIKASEQLNGVVKQFNAIAEAKLPTWNGSAWTAATKTRNPAWAYAEVLRGASNENPVDDSLIDGDGLKTWADACDAAAQDGNPKWQFDAVIDYQTTVFETLRDIATAGRASFAMVNGKYTVVQDLEQSTPIQHFSPRNSWDFSSTKVFADTIHGIKVRFINPDRDYQQDEVIAYDDGYTSANATKFVTMQAWGCTNKNQAWREGRYQLAVARLRPEIYSLKCDIENLICTRGDLVRVTHDVTGWGQKAARILTVNLNGSSECTDIDIDEEVTMVSGNTYNLRLRSDSGGTSLEPVDINVGTVTNLVFTTPIAAGSVPKVGDLVFFGQTDLETVELVVKTIKPGDDLTAELELLDAAPDIHDSDTGTIPAFDPKITNTPPPQKAIPDQPVIIDIFSDEDALALNPDGSETPQIIIDIEPQPPEATVLRTGVEVRYKDEEAAEYTTFTVWGNPTRLIISPVLENKSYDLGVRALSHFGETSTWKERLGYSVIGRFNPPATPANFRINIVNDQAQIYWDANTESDMDHYLLKFSPKTTGATYENGVDLMPKLPKTATSATAPARTGTYFIKAYDSLGKGSATAAEVTTLFESVKGLNVIETQTEDPTFSGTKTNCLVNTEGYLILDTTVLWDDIPGNIDDWIGLIDAGGGTTGSIATQGTYEFTTYTDLGAKYTSRVTANIDQKGIDYSNTVDALQGNIDDLQGLWDDLTSNAVPDTNVKLQIATTDDDPSGAPTWSSWSDFFVGDYTARALKFRAVLTSNNVYQTPRVEFLSVTVDMPDRIEGAQDLSSGTGGYAVTYSPAFKAVKKIGITLQDGQQGDYYVITGKSTTGFTVTFYDKNDVDVDRTFDWDVIGYGHLAT